MSKKKKGRQGRRKSPPATVRQQTDGFPPQNSRQQRQKHRNWPQQHPIALALSFVAVIVSTTIGVATIRHYREQARFAELANRSLVAVEAVMNEPEDSDLGGRGLIEMRNAGRVAATMGPMAIQGEWGQLVVNQLQGMVIPPGETREIETCLPIGWNEYWLHRYRSHDYKPVAHVVVAYSDTLASERIATSCFRFSPQLARYCDAATVNSRPALPDNWRTQDSCRENR